MRTVAVVMGGVLTFFILAPDVTQAAEAPPSRRVSYADLNLRAEEGRATLVRRVKYAAKQVCFSASPSMLTYRRDRECVRKTVDVAMSQVERAFEVAQMTR